VTAIAILTIGQLSYLPRVMAGLAVFHPDSGLQPPRVALARLDKACLEEMKDKRVPLECLQ